MREITAADLLAFYDFLFPGREFTGAYLIMEIEEIANYATWYGFDARPLFRAITDQLTALGCSAPRAMTLAEKHAICEACDTITVNGMFVAELLGTIERINTIYGIDGSDYQECQSYLTELIPYQSIAPGATDLDDVCLNTFKRYLDKRGKVAICKLDF
jgi:hypothetical protein